MNFKRINTDNFDINRVQDNIQNLVNQINISITNGTIINTQVLTTDTIVNHLLGRKPKGWIVVDKDANADVWRSGSTTDKKVILSATTSVNVVLYFF